MIRIIFFVWVKFHFFFFLLANYSQRASTRNTYLIHKIILKRGKDRANSHNPQRKLIVTSLLCNGTSHCEMVWSAARSAHNKLTRCCTIPVIISCVVSKELQFLQKILLPILFNFQEEKLERLNMQGIFLCHTVFNSGRNFSKDLDYVLHLRECCISVKIWARIGKDII